MDKIKQLLSSIVIAFFLAGLCPAQEESLAESATEVVQESAAPDEPVVSPEKKSVRKKGKDKKNRKAGKDREAEAPATQGDEGSGAIVCCWILGAMWLITLPAAGVSVYRSRISPALAMAGFLICLTLAGMFWYGAYFEESTAWALFCFFIPGIAALPWMTTQGGLDLPGLDAAMSNISGPHVSPIGGLVAFLLPIVLLLVLLAGSVFMALYCWGRGVYRSFLPEEEM